jgi:hypothetical protein
VFTHVNVTEHCNNSDPKGPEHRKFFLWQLGMIVLQFCFKISIKFQINSIYRYSAGMSKSARKGKAKNRNSGSIIFKSWWSFVELFSKQKNGLRILKNILRISRVKKYQVWKVKEVIQFNYHTLNLDSEGFSIFVHLVMCLCSPCRTLLRLFKWPVTFMYKC